MLDPARTRTLRCCIPTNASKPPRFGAFVMPKAVDDVAQSKLRCNECEQHLTLHCPETNTTCDWLVCRNVACSAFIYDLHRGLLRHRDDRVEAWGEA